MRLRTLQNGFFLLLLALVTLAFVWVVRDFFAPVLWAATFAIVFRHPYRHIRRALRGRENAAAGLTTLAVILLVLVPVGLLVTALVGEALGLYESVASGEVDVQGPMQTVQGWLPLVQDWLARFGVDPASIQRSLQGAADAAGRVLAAQALLVGQNALRLGLMTFVMLYVLYFFLRDGERLVGWLVRAMPLGSHRERRLMERLAEVTRATVKGTMVVGAIQGALGGILFAVLGLPAALFWAVVMAAASLIPTIGTALVWMPAAVVLFAMGDVGRGIALLVGGTIIGSVDNLLRPVLIGHDTAMPDYLVLLSTLGGLALFGFTGLIAGPLIAALFLVVWQMFIEEYGGRDDTSEGAGRLGDDPPAVPEAFYEEAPAPAPDAP
ncbi:MAG TPA: AI-2E family transporter [Rubricoccaceae bacterium]|nr:AI-2E family transporter [Rubricoccaceae bacterium]